MLSILRLSIQLSDHNMCLTHFLPILVRKYSGVSLSFFTVSRGVSHVCYTIEGLKLHLVSEGSVQVFADGTTVGSYPTGCEATVMYIPPDTDVLSFAATCSSSNDCQAGVLASVSRDHDTTDVTDSRWRCTAAVPIYSGKLKDSMYIIMLKYLSITKSKLTITCMCILRMLQVAFMYFEIFEPIFCCMHVCKTRCLENK